MNARSLKRRGKYRVDSEREKGNFVDVKILKINSLFGQNHQTIESSSGGIQKDQTPGAGKLCFDGETSEHFLKQIVNTKSFIAIGSRRLRLKEMYNTQELLQCRLLRLTKLEPSSNQARQPSLRQFALQTVPLRALPHGRSFCQWKSRSYGCSQAKGAEKRGGNHRRQQQTSQRTDLMAIWPPWVTQVST